MKFFLEIADNVEIQKLNDLGILDGVTTKPTLIAKSERPIREVLAEFVIWWISLSLGRGLNGCGGDGS